MRPRWIEVSRVTALVVVANSRRGPGHISVSVFLSHCLAWACLGLRHSRSQVHALFRGMQSTLRPSDALHTCSSARRCSEQREGTRLQSHEAWSYTSLDSVDFHWLDLKHAISLSACSQQEPGILRKAPRLSSNEPDFMLFTVTKRRKDIL